MEKAETEIRVPNFKAVAHHYLTSGIMVRIFRIGKTYRDGEFDGRSTLNYTHIDLMKGDQYVVVPELKDWQCMNDDAVIEMMRALDPDTGTRIDDFKDSDGFAIALGNREYRAYMIGEGKETVTLGYAFIDHKDCADYLRDHSYDVDGLIEAGKAVKI